MRPYILGFRPDLTGGVVKLFYSYWQEAALISRHIPFLLDHLESASVTMKLFSLVAAAGLVVVAQAQSQCASVASAVPACAVGFSNTFPQQNGRVDAKDRHHASSPLLLK